MRIDSEIEITQPSIDSDAFGKLLGMLVLLSRHKKFIVGVPLIVAAIAAGISLSMPNIYTATTKLLSPQHNQASSSAQSLLLGQLNAIGGVGAGLGIKNPNEIYISMLKSRDVMDEIIKRFELQKVYDKPLMVNARNALQAHTKIQSGKDGVIAIDVNDIDPKRAAAISNAYIDALETLTFRLAVTEASRRRLFMEKQLQKTKQDLIEAEVELKKFQETHGLVEPQGQATATISAAAQLRAQITVKEVQLATMRSYATAENPDFIRLQQELAELRAQQAKMGNDKEITPGDVIVPLGKAPTDSLEYVRKAREVKSREMLFEMFAKLYESAKVDESRNPTLIQVLEKAIEPERKSAPPRTVIVLMSGLISLVIAILCVLIRECMHVPMSQSACENWKALKRQLGLERISS
jgi:tyrosine-protein kinase Etk/Wzc